MRTWPLVAAAFAVLIAHCAFAQDAPVNIERLQKQAGDMLDQSARAADAAKRDALVDAAIEIYRQISAAPITSESRRWQVYEGRRMLAHLLGVEKVSAPAWRILYLLGGPDERRQVCAAADEAANLLESLCRDIDEKTIDYRQDRDRTNLMLHSRSATQLRQRAAYTAAWTMLYRGLAIDSGDAAPRKALLESAIKEAQAFLSPQFGMQHEANLLTAVALRELGACDKAVEHLKLCDAPAAADKTRFQARHQIARCYIESGQYDAAVAAIDSFDQFASAASPNRDDKLFGSLLAAMLRNRLHQARGDIAAGQKALLAFAAQWDDADVNAQFLDVLASHYAGVASDKLGPLGLIALARREFRLNNSPRQAAELLRQVLAGDDEVSVLARPLAWWELGYLLERQGRVQNGATIRRRDEAGRAFLKVADGVRAGNVSRQACLNAVICFSGAMGDYAQAGLSGDQLRLEFISALERLIHGWPGDAEVMTWHRILAEQYRNVGLLSQPPHRKGNFLKAAEHFEQVPASSADYMISRREGLKYRLSALREDSPDSPDAPAAQKLIAMLDAFTADASSAGQDEWAAQSQLDKIIVRHDFLGEKQAIFAVEQIAQRWPNTSAAISAVEWEVRMLVQSGVDSDIARAIDLVNQLRHKAPEKAERLIGLVVEQVRRRISVLRNNTFAADELEKYRKAYVQFARVLLERSEGSQEYAARQMCADALCEAGEFDESLRMWKECQADDQQRRAKRAALVDEEFLPMLAAVDQIGADVNRAITQAEAFAKYSAARVQAHPHGRLVKLAMDSATNAADKRQALRDLSARLQDAWRELPLARRDEMAAQATAAANDRAALLANAEEYLHLLRESLETGHDRSIRLALDALRSAPPEEDKSPRVADLAGKLRAGYEAVIESRKAMLDVDAQNLLGLARVHSAMQKYDAAAGLYAQLARGVDRDRFPDMFWEVQMEMAQCLLAGFKHDSAAMRNLAVHIDQLRRTDPEMGGRSAMFGMFESQAKSASR